MISVIYVFCFVQVHPSSPVNRSSMQFEGREGKSSVILPAPLPLTRL